MAAASRTSFWAMPARADADWCRAVIEDLAGRAGSTRHEPHVTLLGDAAEGWRADDVVVALHGAPAVDARLTAVDDEDERYRCVTLRCAPDVVTQLRARLAAVVDDTSADVYRPHLSVLYGDLDADRRRTLLAATTLPDPLPTVTFDAVAAWDTSDAQWAHWRELSRWPLVGTGTTG